MQWPRSHSWIACLPKACIGQYVSSRSYSGDASPPCRRRSPLAPRLDAAPPSSLSDAPKPRHQPRSVSTSLTTHLLSACMDSTDPGPWSHTYTGPAFTSKRCSRSAQCVGLRRSDRRTPAHHGEMTGASSVDGSLLVLILQKLPIPSGMHAAGSLTTVRCLVDTGHELQVNSYILYGPGHFPPPHGSATTAD